MKKKLVSFIMLLGMFLNVFGHAGVALADEVPVEVNEEVSDTQVVIAAENYIEEVENVEASTGVISSEDIVEDQHVALEGNESFVNEETQQEVVEEESNVNAESENDAVVEEESVEASGIEDNRESNSIDEGATKDTAFSALNASTPFAISGNPYTGSLADWDPASNGDTVTNSFERDGVTYNVTSTLNTYQAFTNTIVNTDTGTSNTYSFRYGSGTTSYMYISTDNGSSYTRATKAASNFYTKTDLDGTIAMAKEGTLTTAGGVTLDYVEVMKVDAAGMIQHYFTITNNSTNTYSDLQVVSMLDTELNGNDRISIIATGDGNTYIQDDDITLYNEVIDNCVQYAGRWTSVNAMIDTNQPFETVLAENIDTAVFYVASGSLSPGDILEYAFQEALFTEGEAIGTIVIQYLDEDGNPLANQLVISGAPGTVYATSPISIPGYVLVGIQGDASGLLAAVPGSVVYVYAPEDLVVDVNNPKESPINSPIISKPIVSKSQEIVRANKIAPVIPVNKTIPADQTTPIDNLPATGEAENLMLTILGLSLLAVLGGFVIWMKLPKGRHSQ